MQSLGFGVITSWLTTQKSFSTDSSNIEMFPVAAMECLKDCCKTFLKKNRKEQETQGKTLPCMAAHPTAQTRLFGFWLCTFPVLSSDQTEDASKQSTGLRMGVRWREEGGHRRLPPVQTPPRWQRGALCPADLQGLVHPTQRLPLPQLTAVHAEYVSTEK